MRALLLQRPLPPTLLRRRPSLLTPASPTVAFKLGDKASDPLAMYLCDTYTIPSNLTGDPGMSVPFGIGEHGLPVGVQILAPALKDDVMFRAAATLERHMQNHQDQNVSGS